MDIILLLVVVAAGVLAYLNALSGDFVYDDNWQIVQNYLIQENELILEALTSDVWAFRGSGEVVVSNYWRPAFVMLLIINQRLFGLADTTGWHVMNVLLHALTVGLAYGLLRFLKLTPWVTGAICLLFALHPTHVESVAWISGSPDLLLAPAFLGALWLLLASFPETKVQTKAGRGGKRRRQVVEQVGVNTRRYAAALALAALAMFSKEIGIVLAPAASVAVFARLDKETASLSDRLITAVKRTWPFYLVAVFYFVLRATVLQSVSRPQIVVTLGEMMLTMPSVFAFYLRQALFPYRIGPLYPLPIVRPDGLTVVDFWLPLLVLVTAGFALYWLARRGPVQLIGLALFLLPLLPAFNIQAFTIDQLVHDRYLYLPLLGLLMMLVPTAAGLLEERLRWSVARVGMVCFGAALLLGIPLAVQTTSYNTAWASDLALWERAVEMTPQSAYGWSQYSNALARADRTEDARVAMETSMSLAGPGEITAGRLITDADIALAEGRLEEAEESLLSAIQMAPSNVQLYERLAVVYRQMGDLNRAVVVLDNARQALPHYFCGFTSNLGVVYYLGGEREQALRELERLRLAAPDEHNVVCRMGLIHLARLYAELGRSEDARAVLAEHQALTAALSDETTREQRIMAQELLDALP